LWPVGAESEAEVSVGGQILAADRPDSFITSTDLALLQARLDDYCHHGSCNAFICEVVAICQEHGIAYAHLWGRLRARLLRLLQSPSVIGNLSPEAREGIERLVAGGYLDRKFSERFAVMVDRQPSSYVPGVIPLPLVDRSLGHIYDLRVEERSSGVAAEDFELELGPVCVLLQGVCRDRCGRSFFLHAENYRALAFPAAAERPRQVFGRSCELSLFLALVSLLTGQSLPSDLSATAALDLAGDLRPVDGLELKISALLRERPRVRRLLVAEGQTMLPEAYAAGLEIIPLADISDALELLFGGFDFTPLVAVPCDLTEEVCLVEEDYRKYRFAACHANASRLLEEPRLAPAARFRALWFRGGCRCHFGRVDEALEDFSQARELYENDPDLIDLADYARMRNNLGVSLMDVFRFDEALEVFTENREILERCGARAVLKAENLSSMSQLYCARGCHHEAVDLQRRVIVTMSRAGEPLSRNLGYLAHFLTRFGEFKSSAAELFKARNELRREGGEQGVGREFLDWYEAELGWHCIRTGREPEKWQERLEKLAAGYVGLTDGSPHARGLVWKFAGLARLTQGDGEKASARLDPSLIFFEEGEVPMYLLLAASIRIERLIFRLESGADSDVDRDLPALVRNLSFQPDIHRHFRLFLDKLSFTEVLPATDDGRTVLLNDLVTLRDMIPY
jgi:tetratricopeptide (TPR) repeat protein